MSKNIEENLFSFVTERDDQSARENRTPENMTRHTLWSTNVYKKWAEARNKEFTDFVPENVEFKHVPNLEDLSVNEINYWFSRLALEVRKVDGGEYKHEVLYSLFCGLNRSIQVKHPALSIFNSPELKPLQQALDGRLKELQASQKPVKKRADAVSVTVWNTGVLGTDSPDSVINTLLFLTGKLFALRGGKEQRELMHDQFEFVDKPDGMVIVKYTEKVSKTNQGGIKRRKHDLKRVEHVENPQHEESFTFVYQFYLSMWYVLLHIAFLYVLENN